jgi:hypothetical protein
MESVTKHATLFLAPAAQSQKQLTPEQQLASIKENLETLMRNRMILLSNEALTLASDMSALVERLRDSGSGAAVDDLRSGRWYRTAADVRLIRDIYSFVCQVMGVKGDVVELPQDSESVPEPLDFDSVID